MKSLKKLIYTENSKYPLENGFFALGLIDRKKQLAENRWTDDEKLQNRYGTLARKCREEFANLFQEDCKSIVYCHAQDKYESLSAFINLVEAQLNIPDKQKTQVFSTQINTISAIRVSPFWLNCSMRRQLFTMIIRAGAIHYKKDQSIIDTFKQYALGKTSIEGIELFLNGYYNFTDESRNILAGDMHKGAAFQFQNKSKEELIDKVITKENKEILSPEVKTQLQRKKTV